MSPEFFEANWPFILIVALVVLVLAFFWLAGRRTTSVITEDKKDVLDEGAAPAARNQALIDAPTSVAQDVGVTSANANSDIIAAANATADAEAGASVAPMIKEDPVPTNVGEAPAAPAPEPAQAKAPDAAGDDLTVIKGLGPKLASLLNSLGITTYAQIASWDEAEIDRVDGQLDRFKGRIRRDSWVEQAKLLAEGDETGFADRFGQNG